MLADRRCFFLFYSIRYGSPPGGAISLVPLWFPWWFCSSWQSTWGPYSFVLLTRNTRLAWCLCMMSICKFCSPSLHCLIWFSRCSSAWWVPWARAKPVADAHLCNSCGVVIIDMLAGRCCFFLFHTTNIVCDCQLNFWERLRQGSCQEIPKPKVLKPQLV